MLSSPASRSISNPTRVIGNSNGHAVDLTEAVEITPADPRDLALTRSHPELASRSPSKNNNDSMSRMQNALTKLRLMKHSTNDIPKPHIMRHRDRERHHLSQQPHIKPLFNTNWVFPEEDTAVVKISTEDKPKITAQYEIACSMRFHLDDKKIANDNIDKHLTDTLNNILNHKAHWLDKNHVLTSRSGKPDLTTTNPGDELHVPHHLALLDFVTPKSNTGTRQERRLIPMNATFLASGADGDGLTYTMIEQLDHDAIDGSQRKKDKAANYYDHIQQICVEVKSGVVTIRSTGSLRQLPTTLLRKASESVIRAPVEKSMADHMQKIIDSLINETKGSVLHVEDVTQDLIAKQKE
jgi:hypothetical protein